MVDGVSIGWRRYLEYSIAELQDRLATHQVTAQLLITESYVLSESGEINASLAKQDAAKIKLTECTEMQTAITAMMLAT